MAINPSDSVTTIMSRSVILLDQYATIDEVIKLFHRHRISGAPVVDDEQRIVGTLSKSDLAGTKVLKWVSDGGNLETIVVKDIMHPDVFVLHYEASISDAAHVMLHKKIHRIFIVDDNSHIMGVISSFDLLVTHETMEDEVALERRRSKRRKKRQAFVEG